VQTNKLKMRRYRVLAIVLCSCNSHIFQHSVNKKDCGSEKKFLCFLVETFRRRWFNMAIRVATVEHLMLVNLINLAW